MDLGEDLFLKDDPGPTIAEHAHQCSRLFKDCMHLPAIVRDPTVLDDQLARFTLWTSNMDVFGPLNISLDYRLRYSPTVVDIIHQLLNVVYASLNSLKPPETVLPTPTAKRRRITEEGSMQVTKRVADDSSDSDDEESRIQSVESILVHTIGGTVTRLLRLSNAIRKSATASRTRKIGEYKENEEANTAINELRLYTESYLRFRFPQAPKALCSALVEANAQRLRRLHYQKSHRRRIALSTQHPLEDTRPVQLPKMPESALTVRFTASEKSEPARPPPPPITYATTARQTAVGALLANSTVEVPRAKSVLVNNKLAFPPVPTTSECPYCGVIVDFPGTTKSMRWNDHVIRDLEPFICIFDSCTSSSQHEHGPSTFETSKAWMNHMQNAHGYVWECRAPSHAPMIFEQETEFQKHSSEEHGVPMAYVETLSSAARRPILKKIEVCPFGDDFSAPENAQSNSIFTSEAFHLHVATHMKEIALLTLQKLPSDNQGESEDVASDAPLDDEGAKELRGSMYSILDDEDLDFKDEAEDRDLDIPEEKIRDSINRLDLEDKDHDGMTMLHRAVWNNELYSAQTLIQQGANVRSKANDGRTALHYAALNPNPDINMMELLLEKGAGESINTKDNRGQAPMHYLAQSGFSDGIKLLANCGADINLSDDHGLSPYLWAIIAGQPRATSLLLSLGVGVYDTSANGKSALWWAASRGHSSIVRLLLSEGRIPGLDPGAVLVNPTHTSRSVPLGAAASCGDLNTVQLLLDYGADPKCRDHEGWSAIHWAAEQGHLGILYALLNHAADVNVISSHGTSPLHCAANGGHTGIVSELLRQGADPLKATCHGWTPLHHAAFMGHEDTARILLNAGGIDVSSSQDNHGWSVLHLAALGRHLRTIEVLIDNPVVSKSRLLCDDSGLTAEDWLDLELDSHSLKTIRNVAFKKSRCCRPITQLRHAAYHGNLVMIEFLLKEGWDINSTDSGNRTALYHAAKKGDNAVLNTLLGNKANPNILPTAYAAWEDFITNDNVLQRLRQSGYAKPMPNPDLDYQIKAALRQGGKYYSTQQAPQHASASSWDKNGLRSNASPRSDASLRVRSNEEQKSSFGDNQPATAAVASSGSTVANMWKRLRGKNT
ncbi:MAG: hypothetical protein Q9216_002559 [Gyalolechia sp. 2 TL-2023]